MAVILAIYSYRDSQVHALLGKRHTHTGQCSRIASLIEIESFAGAQRDMLYETQRVGICVQSTTNAFIGSTGLK